MSAAKTNTATPDPFAGYTSEQLMKIAKEKKAKEDEKYITAAGTISQLLNSTFADLDRDKIFSYINRSSQDVRSDGIPVGKYDIDGDIVEAKFKGGILNKAIIKLIGERPASGKFTDEQLEKLEEHRVSE